MQTIPAGERAALFLDSPPVDRLLHASHDEPRADLAHEIIPKGERLRKIMSGIDMEKREGNPAGEKRLAGQVDENNRVFAP